MSKRIKTRDLKLKKLPYRKYYWIVHVSPKVIEHFFTTKQAADEQVKEKFSSLDETVRGVWRAEVTFYTARPRAIKRIKFFFEHTSDVVLFRMCYPDIITKIFQVDTSEDILSGS